MASINREPNGRRTIQFIGGDGRWRVDAWCGDQTVVGFGDTQGDAWTAAWMAAMEVMLGWPTRE